MLHDVICCNTTFNYRNIHKQFYKVLSTGLRPAHLLQGWVMEAEDPLSVPRWNWKKNNISFTELARRAIRKCLDCQLTRSIVMRLQECWICPVYVSVVESGVTTNFNTIFAFCICRTHYLTTAHIIYWIL
jgi:hypothetical protein